MRDICRLEGPIKPVPMTLLEIDNHCGLVVGTNGCVVGSDGMRMPLQEAQDIGFKRVTDNLIQESKSGQTGST